MTLAMTPQPPSPDHALPTTIQVVEVGPRDGLQNQDTVLRTSDKVTLVERLVRAGARRIEVASFVHPERVPQMADAEAVCAAVPRDAGVVYSGLVLNERGFRRAREAGVDEVNVALVATETFCRRNQGVSVAEAVDTWLRVADQARGAGLGCAVTIGASFGCPFEGEVAVDRLVELAVAVAAAGPDEISLADTIGVGTPVDVRERVATVRGEIGDDIALRCHFHNTRNTGIANAFAAIEAGVHVLDASVGGIGGCPFAPEATGNIATDDLVYMLDRVGVGTGLDLRRITEVSPWLGQRLGEDPPGLVWRAGGFPTAN